MFDNVKGILVWVILPVFVLGVIALIVKFDVRNVTVRDMNTSNERIIEQLNRMEKKLDKLTSSK